MWTTIVDPLEKVLIAMRRWAKSNLTWWKLRDEKLLECVSTPRSHNRDVWGNAFLDLSKLVIEGFQVKAIRKELKGRNIPFDKGERSIALLERFLIGRGKIKDGQKLVGLRTVQYLRSKLTAHFGGSEAEDLAIKAMQEHETYSAHFESVCEILVVELNLIEQAFS